MQTSEEKYRDLLERITDGFIALDKNWNYIYVNRRIGELVHRSPESLIGKNLWEEFPDVIGTPTYNAFQQAMEEQRYVSNLDYYPPLDLWHENHIYPSPEGISVFIRDITEQKKAEERQRQSEETRRLIMNSALDAIVCVNKANRITVWNRQAENIFGWKADEAIGKSLVETIIPEKYREKHLQGFAHYQRTGEGPLLNKLIEITALNKQGEEFPVELAIVVVKQEQDEFYCAFIRDITERKKSEEKIKTSYEQLRQLASHLQVVREQERTSIAREIHDELGQQLTGLKIDISWIEKRLSNGDPDISKKIKEVLGLLDNTIKTVRKIASELRPSILDDIGIVEALEWQSKEFERRSGIKTSFSSKLEGLQLPENISTAFFRIFQESLTNVARHAAASAIQASFERRDGKLVLEILDNGKGMDLSEMKHKKTLGLLGMKERTQMIGGEFHISSKPGNGTRVLISIPSP